MAKGAAVYNPVLTDTYKANGAIAAYHFVGCVSEADGDVSQIDGSNEVTLGVALDKAADNEILPIGLLGIFPVVAGAVVAKGARIMSNNAGHAITLAASGYSMGIALEAAAASGDIISCLIIPTNYLMA